MLKWYNISTFMLLHVTGSTHDVHVSSTEESLAKHQCERRTTPHDIHVSSATNDSIAKDHCDRRTTTHEDLTPGSALPHQSPLNGK